EDLAAVQKRLEPHFRLKRPEGPGPFPAVIMVSGCSGFTPPESPAFFTRRAAQFTAEGAVVIFVDHLAARGYRTCADRGRTGGGWDYAQEIGRDVVAAAAYLSGLPFVKPAEIVAVGWSLGGGGVLAALGAMPPSVTPLLRSVVALYPYCPDVKPW